VLRDNKPVVGASVLLAYEGIPYRELWSRVKGNRAQQAVEQAFNPFSKTGTDGTAHFRQLPPGNYSIHATLEDEDSLRAHVQNMGSYRNDSGVPYGSLHGIPVRLGENPSCAISIYPESHLVQFSLQRHDGEAARDDMSFVFSRMQGGGDGSTSLHLNQSGIGGYYFDHEGLFSASLRYSDPPHRSRFQLPYYRADAVVAVSPRLAKSPPIDLAAGLREGSTAHIRVYDLDQKPIKAVVHITRQTGHIIRSGSIVHEDGVRFTGLPPGDYVARATLPGDRPIRLASEAQRLPNYRDLTNRAAIMPEPLRAHDTGTQELTLRLQPVGYARGVLRAPPGLRTSEFAVLPEAADQQRGTSVSYLRETGEFVIGPYTPGRVNLRIESSTTFRLLGSQQVAIKAGQVTQTTINAHDFPAAPASGVTLLDGGGLSYREGEGVIPVRVVLHDGKTPAYGAQVTIFAPGYGPPTGAGFVGADGSIAPRFRRCSSNDWDVADLCLTRPTIVAWLPGLTGPRITTLDPAEKEPLVLKLPPSIQVNGKVTIGGRGLSGQIGQVRVLARPIDQDCLQNQFPIDTSAQADGTFELAGLVKGKYQVQAALDGIWLSSAQEFSVADNAPPDPIEINIPEPGGRVVLRIENADGTVATHTPVRVVRPAGPLAEILWPKSFAVNAHGQAYLPALEAGENSIRIGETKATISVPSLTETLGAPTFATIKLVR
jgi:hypothetical protein